MSLWKAELSFDAPTVSFDPSLLNNNAINTFVAGVALGVQIVTAIGPDEFYAITIQLRVFTTDSGATHEYQTRVLLDDIGVGDINPVRDALTGNLDTLIAPSGENGARFLAGGKMSIEIDDVGHTLTYQFDGFSAASLSFASVGLSPGDDHCYADKIGVDVAQPFDTTKDSSYDFAFHSFFGSKDATHIQGAMLGTIHPGSWLTAGIHSGADSPWAIGTAGFPHTNGITPSRLTVHAAYTYPADFPGGAFFDEWRTRSGNSLSDVDVLIDLHCSSAGWMNYARVTKQDPDKITVGRSEDKGHTWTEILLTPGVGMSCTSPSLSELPDGSLSLMFHDGIDVQWWKSTDGGRSFTALSIFAAPFPWVQITYPKHLIHPSGIVFFSYNQGGNWWINLYDYAFGASSPLRSTELVSGAGTGVYPAMMFAPRGDVILAYAESDTKTIESTEDLGSSWSARFHLGVLERQVAHIWRAASGQFWHLYQSSTDTSLQVFRSEDGYDRATPGDNLVIAGTTIQFPDIDVLPDGSIFVLFQVYNAGTDSYDVIGFISDNLAQNWMGA